jgi:hypothetical protein
MGTHQNRVTDEDAAIIFEAYKAGRLDSKEIGRIAKAIGFDARTVQRWRKALKVIAKHGAEGLLSDERWPIIEKDQATVGSLTRAFVQTVTRMYLLWQQPPEQIENAPESPPPSLHVEALLKARDRLAEQVLAISDPEEQLLRDRNPDLLGGVGGRDGWLPWWHLPPGDITGEPGFKWLYEHTSHDPHWDALKLQASSGGTVVSEWWSEYDQYRSNLQSIVRQVLEASRNAIDDACLAASNSSAPVLFPSFAVTAVRDALRVHLGRTPLMTPNYEISSETSPEGRTSFTVYCMGEKLATGVADRVELESQIVASITRTYRTLREQLMAWPDVRGITERWHGLVLRAREFAAWLKSLGVEDFERTTCSFCRPGDR